MKQLVKVKTPLVIYNRWSLSLVVWSRIANFKSQVPTSLVLRSVPVCKKESQISNLLYFSAAYLARVLWVLQHPQYWDKLLLSSPFSTRNFGTINHCQHLQLKSPKYASIVGLTNQPKSGGKCPHPVPPALVVERKLDIDQSNHYRPLYSVSSLPCRLKREKQIPIPQSL